MGDKSSEGQFGEIRWVGDGGKSYFMGMVFSMRWSTRKGRKESLEHGDPGGRALGKGDGGLMALRCVRGTARGVGDERMF